jgi:adenylate kinase family enzyme
LCDEVLVNVGKSSDQTEAEVNKLAEQLGNVRVHTFDWNENNRNMGSELAIQANNLLPYVTAGIDSWVCYLQADELIAEWDVEFVRRELSVMPAQISQVELLRTYFWGDLQTRAVTEEIYLGRMFRAGTHTIGGDGMYLIRQSGEVIRWPGKLIYHYSRMGDEQIVNRRLRNLDRMFHPDEIVESFAPFVYNSKDNLRKWGGQHPSGIGEFYGE